MTLAIVPARLGELEAIIDRDLPTFIEVGLALAEIRDDRLYRPEFHSFEAYCRERWGFSRSHGDRMIAASKVTPMGASFPANERQARKMRGLSAEEEPIEKDWIVWGELAGLMETMMPWMKRDAYLIADSVPPRRRAATARKLRKLGLALGRIASNLERIEGQS